MMAVARIKLTVERLVGVTTCLNLVMVSVSSKWMGALLVNGITVKLRELALMERLLVMVHVLTHLGMEIFLPFLILLHYLCKLKSLNHETVIMYKLFLKIMKDKSS